jgi:ligand-binding sensor domain-containing protein
MKRSMNAKNITLALGEALLTAACLFAFPAGMRAQAPAAKLSARPSLYTKWINYTSANGFPEGEVYCVTVDGSRVWAGTSHGLVLLEDGRVKHIFSTADGLAGRAVMSVAVNHENGDVWVGTFGGLSLYSGGAFTNYTNLTSGLANDLVYGVALQGHILWVATAAGVNRLDTYTGAWSIFNETNAPFEEPWAYGISVAPEKVYFAVWGGGILAYDLAQQTWKPYTDPDGQMEMVLYRNQGLIHNVVSSVSYNEETKTFWASTYFGLSGYDGRNWHNYLTKDSGLASNFINAVQSRGDEVWTSTQSGLSELNTRTNTWITYTRDRKTGRGEMLIARADGSKQKVSSETSLAHNYILNTAFQGDDIWVATGQGLSHGIHGAWSSHNVKGAKP